MPCAWKENEKEEGEGEEKSRVERQVSNGGGGEGLDKAEKTKEEGCEGVQAETTELKIA